MYKKFLLTLISILLISFNAIAASDGELILSENEKPKKIKENLKNKRKHIVFESFLVVFLNFITQKTKPPFHRVFSSQI